MRFLFRERLSLASPPTRAEVAREHLPKDSINYHRDNKTARAKRGPSPFISERRPALIHRRDNVHMKTASPCSRARELPLFSVSLSVYVIHTQTDGFILWCFRSLILRPTGRGTRHCPPPSECFSLLSLFSLIFETQSLSISSLYTPCESGLWHTSASVTLLGRAEIGHRKKQSSRDHSKPFCVRGPRRFLSPSVSPVPDRMISADHARSGAVFYSPMISS